MTEDGPVCGEPLITLRCDLPAGHPPGEHHVEMALPPDVNRMIDAKMTELDAAVAHYRQMRRWSRFTFWLWAGSLGVYLWLIFQR